MFERKLFTSSFSSLPMNVNFFSILLHIKVFLMGQNAISLNIFFFRQNEIYFFKSIIMISKCILMLRLFEYHLSLTTSRSMSYSLLNVERTTSSLLGTRLRLGFFSGESFFFIVRVTVIVPKGFQYRSRVF